MTSNSNSEPTDTNDNILDDYPVLPNQDLDDSYKRVKPWFWVGITLIIIIILCL